MTYLAYFNLTEAPFKPSPDPQFMWCGEVHKKALATLRFGLLNRRGFILLIGDVGTGKTTVINKLVQGLDDHTRVAGISDPGLHPLDFYKAPASRFAFKGHIRTKGDFLIELNLFLHRAHQNGKNVVVIVDEAQRLSDELLEEIRLLSNMENIRKDGWGPPQRSRYRGFGAGLGRPGSQSAFAFCWRWRPPMFSIPKNQTTP
jgi:general secretion pathway protein A